MAGTYSGRLGNAMKFQSFSIFNPPFSIFEDFRQIMKKNLTTLLEHYPTLDTRRLLEDSSSAEHDIFIYDNQRIFKFPNQLVFQNELKKEIQFINYIRPYISFQLPEYDIIKKPFVSYKMIKGQVLSKFLWDTQPIDVQEQMLKNVIEFLRALHHVPFFDEDQLPQANLRRQLKDWEQLFEEAEQLILPNAPYATQQWIIDLKQWFEKHRTELESPLTRPALIHGDLSLHHLIMDRDSNVLKGVIDFGFAGIGDPAIDIAAVLTQFGESQLLKMKSVYPAIEAHLFRAKLWALSTPLWWAIQGVKTGDRSWFFAGLAGAGDIRLD